MAINRIIFLLSVFASFLPLYSIGQTDGRITTIEYVEVLNDRWEESRYYYKNNWKVLREMAVDSQYIHSYQLFECPTSDELPSGFMLITTYRDNDQYEKREKHFSKLIEIKGDLRLLNSHSPATFRKSLYSIEEAVHLD